MNLLLMFMLAPVTVTLRAFVVQCYWGWFLTPLFGMAPPSLPMAAGLAMFIHLLTTSSSAAVSKEWREATPVVRAVTVMALNALALFMGWIVSLLA